MLCEIYLSGGLVERNALTVGSSSVDAEDDGRAVALPDLSGLLRRG